jgi:lipoprotein NlpD
MIKQSKHSHTLILTMTLGLLAACGSTSHRAPVVERAARPAPAKAPVAEERQKERDPNTYTVKKGDTLLRIALDHGQSYRDLVSWNGLSNPDDIKVDQVLRMRAPEAGAANGGAQTAAVTAAPVAPTPPPAPVVKKTTPRGDKRPYSDATLAELQRADGAPAVKAEAKPAAAEAPPRPVAAPAAAPAPAVAVAASAPLSEEDKLTWIWPSDGKVVATFDEGKNKGIDIAGRAGQSVLAAGSGKVMYAGSGIRGYGNLVIVKHSNNLLSAYAHNRSILVKEGQSVNRGQTIAEMGDSDTDAVKLHFEIRQQGKPVDPSKFLPNR